MDDSSNRGSGPAFDVRSRARDGAGCGNATEDRTKDIGKALRHELLVGIVPFIGHAVGHHRAEERFDSRQQSDGCCW